MSDELEKLIRLGMDAPWASSSERDAHVNFAFIESGLVADFTKVESQKSHTRCRSPRRRLTRPTQKALVGPRASGMSIQKLFSGIVRVHHCEARRAAIVGVAFPGIVIGQNPRAVRAIRANVPGVLPTSIGRGGETVFFKHPVLPFTYKVSLPGNVVEDVTRPIGGCSRVSFGQTTFGTGLA